MFLFALSAIFSLANVNSVFADNDTSAIIEISDLSQISSNLSAIYRLSDNFDATNFETISGTFTGVLDGNGHNIYGSLKNPLFEKIGEGAKVYNISFAPQKIVVENNTSIATISYSVYEESGISEQNIGLLAGVISGAEISQVKISGVSISGAVEKVVTESGEAIKLHTLKNNTNLGFLAGKALYGTQIKNCVVNNSSINVTIGETISENFNFGGLVGYIGNATVSNCIIDLYADPNGASASKVQVISDYNKTINFGVMAGYADDSKNYLFNNVAIIDQANISISQVCENVNVGSIIGNLYYELNSTNIQGFLTTFKSEYFGKKSTNNANYILLTTIDYATLNSAVFIDSSYWYDLDTYKWNYSKVWVAEAGAKYPVLQCFRNYAVSFDAEESLKSLNLEVMPEVENNDYTTIITGFLSVDSEPDGDETATLESVEYGSTIYLMAQIATEKNYDKFFYISGLQLNGKTIYDNVSGNKNADISVSVHHADENDNVYVYKIENFNANCEGVYNILLGRNTFKLNVYVYDLGNDETGSIIPGKFKTNSETNPVQEKVLEMQYGERFILNTNVTNTDYSDKASWFVFDNSAKDVFDQPIAFEPIEENANFYASKIEFTFNESSEIFKNQNEDTKTYFDMANYTEYAGEDDVVKSNFDLILVYNKRVKEVKIVFRYEDGEQIKENIANLLIDKKSDRLTWNEEEGVYYAKVAFDWGSITEYTIEIDSMDTSYEFLSWTYEIGKLAVPDDNELAGLFEVSENTEEPLVIYLELKEGTSADGGNLLWLWIVLGILGVTIVITIIIVIIKKRGGGGSSYKKYYY